MVAFLILAAALSQGPVAPAPQSSRAQIDNLVQSFAAEMSQDGDPAPYLSPKVIGSTRTAEIKEAAKDYIAFDISDYNLQRDLTFQNPTHATLAARVNWKTAHMESGSKEEIQLEEVDGRWYFENFRFLVFAWWVIILVVVWAVSTLVLQFHWRYVRTGSWGRMILWHFLLITPIGWILYPMIKPWRTRETATGASAPTGP